MGMYTEFYFRACVKDGPVADWLHSRINFLQQGGAAFDEHPFFDCPRWWAVFNGGGAVYQESQGPRFYPKDDRICHFYNRLALSSSLKNYHGEIEKFVDWITPHLEQDPGEFLGYSLYEDSWSGDRENPTLFFMPPEKTT